MMEYEYEYGYDDFVLGEVSCDSEDQAIEMDCRGLGVAWRKTWKDGSIIAKDYIA